MRVPGGGASCLGVGCPGSGALPPPTLLKSFHRLLVTEPVDRVSIKQAGLEREHEHSSQEFLVVGTIVGSCLIPLPVPMRKRHQTPFIGRVVMLHGTIAVQT